MQISQANIRQMQANIKQIKVKYLVNLRHILSLSLTYLLFITSHISCIFQAYLSHISEHFKV